MLLHISNSLAGGGSSDLYGQGSTKWVHKAQTWVVWNRLALQFAIIHSSNIVMHDTAQYMCSERIRKLQPAVAWIVATVRAQCVVF